MEIARYSIAQNVPAYARSFPDNCVTLSRNGVDTESTIIALPRGLPRRVANLDSRVYAEAADRRARAREGRDRRLINAIVESALLEAGLRARV